MPLAPGVYAFRRPNVAHYIGGNMECGPMVSITVGMVNDPHVIDLVNSKELTYHCGPFRPAVKQVVKSAPEMIAAPASHEPVSGEDDRPKKKKHW